MEDKKVKLTSQSGETPEVSLGTLYDVNKKIVSEMKGLSHSKITEKVKEMRILAKKSDNQYFMFLCRERYDFTIFSFKKDGADFDYWMSVCLNNRMGNKGSIKSIEMTQDKLAYEIWIDIDGESFCYYFFPYDSGVIEC